MESEILPIFSCLSIVLVYIRLNKQWSIALRHTCHTCNTCLYIINISFTVKKLFQSILFYLSDILPNILMCLQQNKRNLYRFQTPCNSSTFNRLAIQALSSTSECKHYPVPWNSSAFKHFGIQSPCNSSAFKLFPALWNLSIFKYFQALWNLSAFKAPWQTIFCIAL